MTAKDVQFGDSARQRMLVYQQPQGPEMTVTLTSLGQMRVRVHIMGVTAGQ